MRGAFDAATVPEDAIRRLEPAMTNYPADRHVLAAAVAGVAQAIVTLNLKHFPDEACAPFAVEVLNPDEFLLDLYDLEPDAVTAALRRQASILQRPSMTFEQLLDLLAASVPNFADALR